MNKNGYNKIFKEIFFIIYIFYKPNNKKYKNLFFFPHNPTYIKIKNI